jgi:hypothetical protein
MHDCPECGESCDCDGEDHEQPAPPDCRHECDDDDDGDDDIGDGL